MSGGIWKDDNKLRSLTERVSRSDPNQNFDLINWVGGRGEGV